MFRVVVLVAVAATAVAVLAAAAPATPPGRSGQIAFTRRRACEGGHPSGGVIFTIGVDGRGERRVTRPPAGASDVQPDWSPDGSRIVFERQFEDKPYEIRSVRPDGSDLRQIDPGCPPGIPESQICEEEGPAWSPDGKRIAYGNPFGKLKYIGSRRTRGNSRAISRKTGLRTTATGREWCGRRATGRGDRLHRDARV